MGFLAETNPNYGCSFYNWWPSSLSNIPGVLKSTSFIKKTSKIGHSLFGAPLLNEIKENSGRMLGIISMTQIKSETEKAYKSISALKEKDDGNHLKKKMRAWKDSLHALRVWGATAFLFTESPTVRLFERGFRLGREIPDIMMTMDNYLRGSQESMKACKLSEDAEAVKESTNYYLHRLAKNTVKIASGVLSLAAVASDLKLLPQLSPTCHFSINMISLLSTMLSIRSDYVRDTGKYKVIDFQDSSASPPSSLIFSASRN